LVESRCAGARHLSPASSLQSSQISETGNGLPLGFIVGAYYGDGWDRQPVCEGRSEVIRAAWRQPGVGRLGEPVSKTPGQVIRSLGDNPPRTDYQSGSWVLLNGARSLSTCTLPHQIDELRPFHLVGFNDSTPWPVPLPVFISTV